MDEEVMAGLNDEQREKIEEMHRITEEYNAKMQALMDEVHPADPEQVAKWPKPKGQVIKNQERVMELVQVELTKLGRMGLQTQMIQTDGFVIETKINAMIGFLAESGVLSEDQMRDFNIFYSNMMLSKLRALRNNIEREQTQAQILEGIGSPGILGPNGEVIG